MYICRSRGHACSLILRGDGASVATPAPAVLSCCWPVTLLHEGTASLKGAPNTKASTWLLAAALTAG